MAENTYILYNETKQGCIIDPGCYYDHEFSTLTAFVQAKGLSVAHILLTHAHLDHVFGLDTLCNLFSLQPYMHDAEEPVLKFGPQMAIMYGLNFKTYSGSWITLKDKDSIAIGDEELEVIYVPGHSPGHVAFYCKKQNFVIGGDVLFQQSIGRTDLPLGNHDTLLQSIKTRLFPLPDHTVVHPGHGPSTTIGDEKRLNPFLQD